MEFQKHGKQLLWKFGEWLSRHTIINIIAILGIVLIPNLDKIDYFIDLLNSWFGPNWHNHVYFKLICILIILCSLWIALEIGLKADKEAFSKQSDAYASALKPIIQELQKIGDMDALRRAAEFNVSANEQLQKIGELDTLRQSVKFNIYVARLISHAATLQQITLDQQKSSKIKTAVTQYEKTIDELQSNGLKTFHDNMLPWAVALRAVNEAQDQLFPSTIKPITTRNPRPITNDVSTRSVTKVEFNPDLNEAFFKITAADIQDLKHLVQTLNSNIAQREGAAKNELDAIWRSLNEELTKAQ